MMIVFLPYLLALVLSGLVLVGMIVSFRREAPYLRFTAMTIVAVVGIALLLVLRLRVLPLSQDYYGDLPKVELRFLLVAAYSTGMLLVSGLLAWRKRHALAAGILLGLAWTFACNLLSCADYFRGW